MTASGSTDYDATAGVDSIGSLAAIGTIDEAFDLIRFGDETFIQPGFGSETMKRPGFGAGSWPGRWATSFGGAADYYLRSADLTGSADGDKGILSALVRIDADALASL